MEKTLVYDNKVYGIKEIEQLEMEISILRDAYFQLEKTEKKLRESLAKENISLKRQHEFLRMISHQLRTPLSVFKYVLGELEGEIKDKEKAGYLSEKCEHLISLVNNLLYFLEIGAEYKIEHKAQFLLSEVIQESISRLKIEIKHKKISIEFKKPNFRDVVEGQRLAIIKIIHSLLDNAVVYNKRGGFVKINISKAKKYLKVSIKDSGIGIPNKEQKKIFSKFFRASNASLGKNEGSGVSLYLAKFIIEAHKGKIGFESEEEKGSTFYFSLPTNL